MGIRILEPDGTDAGNRDPATLRRTHAPNFQLFESEREFARWRQDERRGRSSEEVCAYIRDRGALYGTASAIEEAIEEFLDYGCSGFMVFCNAAPATQALEQLAALPPVHSAIEVPAWSADAGCARAAVLPAKHC